MGTNEIVTFDVYIQSNNCSLNLPISKNENSNPLDKVIKVLCIEIFYRSPYLNK